MKPDTNTQLPPDGDTQERNDGSNRPSAEEVLAAWRKWYDESCPEFNSVDDVEAALGRKGPEAEAEQWRSAVRRVTDNRTKLTERIAELDIENAKLRAEIDARKGDPVTRLHNLARGLEQPLACGHALADWCDRCETCGGCVDAERSASNE